MSPVQIIVIAELLGTSLWFSANSAADDLIRSWHLTIADVGLLTDAVQLGFIAGTLGVSISGFADRHPASRIFAVCAVAGAVANAAFALFADGIASALAWRFAVGVALAGVYPLGMKLIVGWRPAEAGTALAWLVGMLTLGTALPHAVRAAGATWHWQSVILVSSGLAVAAAIMVRRLGDGPRLRSGAVRLPPLQIGRVISTFSLPKFRAAAFGYFGHMWELYAFWTLVPVLLHIAKLPERLGFGDTASLSFLVIAAGTPGCVIGGWVSRRVGSARVAAFALAVSAGCCLVYPLLLQAAAGIQLMLLLLWGMAVVADSPQFSALSTRACPPEMVGGVLSIQNSIGFAVTLCAIALTSHAVGAVGAQIAWWLLPGPVFGFIALSPAWRRGD